jgi:hypothetical protein
MRLAVSQVKAPITPTNTAISTASHQWKRHASSMAQLTPMGVVTNKIGFAIRMGSSASAFSFRGGKQELAPPATAFGIR